MEKMTIIPAIDIMNGECVRLTKGDYATKKVYTSDPLSIALEMEQAGLERLHLVDLDGAKAGKVINLATLEKIAKATQLSIDFGGGIKTKEDLERVLEAGAKQVTIGSLAVKDPQQVQQWIVEFGPDSIILGADALDGKIAINGWVDATGVDLMDFISSYYNRGIRNVLCTDISRDGMLQGTATELYRDIMKRFPDLFLIASGGVSGLHDIDELIAAGIPAVVLGKALYEGRIELKELAKRNALC